MINTHEGINIDYFPLVNNNIYKDNQIDNNEENKNEKKLMLLF